MMTFICNIHRYRANSNLVLTAERDKRAASDATGEVESLTGKLQYRMGDKAGGGSRAPELEEKMKALYVETKRKLEEEVRFYQRQRSRPPTPIWRHSHLYPRRRQKNGTGRHDR